ncbi:MBL fold metallo-hydrolase [Novipirellula sp. SH528]|uniref:MBL fold metallo-hydrolase n=1 Tax=Novipirellula sp. SH528 TaxID=3454466 RepID=UPI003F9FD337
MTVAPGVHAFGDLHPSAAFAIESSEGVILIDTGLDESATRLRELFFSVKLRLEDVRYVLLTHAHYDHVFGTNKVREVSDAVVCAGAEDYKVLSSADRFALFSLFPKTEFSGDPIRVDRQLRDGDVIESGDVTVRVIGCPGHTPGSMCYLVEKEGQRILFAGDVIASLNFGPATYPVHISPRYRGNAVAYLETINRLLQMEPPDLLLTGHPRQQTRSESIRIDTKKWKELLDPAKQELQIAVDRQKSDGPDFLDGIPKQIATGLYYFGELDGIAIYVLQRSDQFVVFNAPGGDSFADFLKAQCKALQLEYRVPDKVLLTSNAETHSSGLKPLAGLSQVVTPQLPVTSVDSSSTKVHLYKEDSKQIADVAIDTLSISHLGEPALAFTFSVDKKQVLVTPSVPRNIGLWWVTRKNGRVKRSFIQPQTLELKRELTASPTQAADYLNSLEKLSEITPDVWLPTLPLTGQNANLYDNEWSNIIEANRDITLQATPDSPSTTTSPAQ